MTTLLAKVAPDATDMIRADHARVLSTFHRYKTDAGSGTKRSLAATICLALEVHAQLEEEIFYPAMGSVDSGLVGKLIPEHDRMRSLIAALRNADPADAQYDMQFAELMREVIHHVADEETRLLPQAERVLGERLGELGARMMKRRLQLMAPHAGELTRHKARATPMTHYLLAAAAVVAGVLLVRHVRRAI
jgi:hemerythrin superfamily protein